MKRVLITGINGFTGKYVAEELRSHGWHVSGIGSSDMMTQSLDYRNVDIMDAAGLRHVVAETQPDAVIHLAAVAFVGHGSAEDFYQVNLLGARRLLAALSATENAPECVVLASSANVYGNTEAAALDEETPVNPANDYAVSKVAMEYMARLWMQELPITIIRPFHYTGIGQSEAFLLPKIVAHFRRRAQTIELGNLDVRRDFSDVRAVAQAYRRVLEEHPSGETINICSGETYSLQEILVMAEEITGHSMRIEVNPNFVRTNEVKELRGDCTKLRELIGNWGTPPLRETLQWMLK